MLELSALAEATIRSATPLAFAALGEVVTERAGLMNIGLEGVIIAGCLGAAVGGAAGGLGAGVAGALIAGVIVAAAFAFFTVTLGGDQVITGTALTVAAYGITGTLYRVAFGTQGASLTLPTMSPQPIPGLSRIPLIGEALFAQPPLTYLLYIVAAVIAWMLYRTRAGLSVRAIGENPSAARVAGVAVDRYRWGAVLVGGACGGLAGASLVLAQVGTFTEYMSAGRGFIAIGIVALGRWNPVGVLAGAVLFGAASSLQYNLQALGTSLPYQLFLAIPYVLTLAALVVSSKRARSPLMLGRRVTDADAALH